MKCYCVKCKQERKMVLVRALYNRANEITFGGDCKKCGEKLSRVLSTVES